jgi:hypothetical protein
LLCLNGELAGSTLPTEGASLVAYVGLNVATSSSGDLLLSSLQYLPFKLNVLKAIQDKRVNATKRCAASARNYADTHAKVKRVR